MSRFFPVAVPKNGLSVGICAVGSDTGFMRIIFPSRLVSVCALLRVRVVAMRRIQHSINAEVHGAAVVIGRAAQVVELEEDELTARDGHVAVGREAADAVVNRWRGGRVEHIHELVRGEVRIERHAQEPALAGRIDGQADEGRREQRSVLDDAQLPALLRHEQPPVGSELHGRGIRQAADHQHVLEPWRQVRRRPRPVDGPAGGNCQGKAQTSDDSFRRSGCHVDGWAFSGRKIHTERAGGNTRISSGNRSTRSIRRRSRH